MEFKGNIIIGQSGGPTAVINASLAGVFSAATAAGVPHIYGMKNGIEGLLNGHILELGAVLDSEQAVTLLRRTPSSFLGSCRYRLPELATGEDTYRKLFDQLDALSIGAFFYIGGNDSMDTIHKLYQYGRKIGSHIRFVGVPKSIDNDLPGTDHTPGYGSAAKYIATVMREIICDATVYDMKNLTVVEIMGRDAGWLTGAAALAASEDSDGPDFVYLPEVPFDLEEFFRVVGEKQKTKKALVVAVSEGIKTADGRYVCEMAGDEKRQDVFGHRMLSGTAQFLAAAAGERLCCKSRGIELNTPQRCAAHLLSAVDEQEAFNVGRGAFNIAAAGRTGEMATLHREPGEPYACHVSAVAVATVANSEQIVPRDYINEAGNGVTEKFMAYARPLIQGEVAPIYENGLPKVLKRR